MSYNSGGDGLETHPVKIRFNTIATTNNIEKLDQTRLETHPVKIRFNTF